MIYLLAWAVPRSSEGMVPSTDSESCYESQQIPILDWQQQLGVMLCALISLPSLADNSRIQHEENAQQLDNATQALKTKNYSEAFQHYALLADKAVPDAMFAVGHLHLNGWGVEKNPDKAMTWFRKALDSWQKAAKAGDPMAHASLGLMYQRGIATPVNQITAKQHYNMAAKLAEPMAKKGNLKPSTSWAFSTTVAAPAHEISR